MNDMQTLANKIGLIMFLDSLPEHESLEVRSVFSGPYDVLEGNNQALIAIYNAYQQHARNAIFNKAIYIGDSVFAITLGDDEEEQMYKIRLRHKSNEYELGTIYVVRLQEKPAPQASLTLSQKDKEDFLPPQLKQHIAKQKNVQKKRQQAQERKRKANLAKEEALQKEREQAREEEALYLKREEQAKKRAERLKKNKASSQARQETIAKQRAESKQAKEQYAASAKAEAKSQAEERTPSPVIFSQQNNAALNNPNIDKRVECDLDFVLKNGSNHMDSALIEAFEGVQDRVCARGIATNGWKQLNGKHKSPQCAQKMLKTHRKLTRETKDIINFVGEQCAFYELKINEAKGARIFGFSYPNDRGDDIITIQPLAYRRKHLNGDAAYQCVFEEAIRTLVKHQQEAWPIFDALKLEQSDALGSSPHAINSGL